MAYDIGGNYGYDQFFIEPTLGTYADYMNMTPDVKVAKQHKNKIQNIYNLENESIPAYKKQYNNVHDYLEHSAKQYSGNNKISDLESLKQKMVEFQHKNDILLIFLIYLILIIIIQYMTTSSHKQPNMYNMPYNPEMHVMRASLVPSAPIMSPVTGVVPSL